MANDRIVVRGAREHNLKNIDVELPRDQLVVLTGLSGSGKSSLAFDTIYAEGQRRYVESLSAYARQFLEQMEKPEVDSIEGLSPAISIEQKTTSRNPRSTVGTVTEIYDYFRVLFARIGIPHCPSCGRVISAQTVQQMVDRVMSQPVGTRLLVLAPVIRGRKGEYKKLFFDLRRQGYSRVRVNGVLRELTDEIDLDKNRKHTIDVLVDRLVVRETVGSRLADSLETALRLADGVVLVEPLGDGDGSSSTAQMGGSGGSGTRPPVKESSSMVPPVKQSRPSVKSPTSENAEPMLFSERLACAECGVSLPEVSPHSAQANRSEKSMGSAFSEVGDLTDGLDCLTGGTILLDSLTGGRVPLPPDPPICAVLLLPSPSPRGSTKTTPSARRSAVSSESASRLPTVSRTTSRSTRTSIVCLRFLSRSISSVSSRSTPFTRTREYP